MLVMVAYSCRHRPGTIARLPSLLSLLFYSFPLGVPVGRAETPNFFMIKQAIGGFLW